MQDALGSRKRVPKKRMLTISRKRVRRTLSRKESERKKKKYDEVEGRWVGGEGKNGKKRSVFKQKKESRRPVEEPSGGGVRGEKQDAARLWGQQGVSHEALWLGNMGETCKGRRIYLLTQLRTKTAMDQPVTKMGT